MSFTVQNAFSYQEIQHKIETSYLYSKSKEFKKDVVAYLMYVYCINKVDAETIFKKSKKKFSEPTDILDFADEKAEDIYEENRV